MSGDPLPNDDEFAGDDELDRLLARARWPQPRAGQLPRLEAHWRQLQGRRYARRRSIAFYAVASAASLLMVGGTAFWTFRAEQSADPARTARQSPGWPTTLIEPAADPPAEGIAGREPSVYERVVLIEQARATRAVEATVSGRSSKATLAESITAAIDALSADAHADVSGPRSILARKRSTTERILWRIVRDSAEENRLGAVRLLAAVATPRSVPMLADLAADPALHRAAVLGLARLAADAELRQLALAESDASLRQELLAALLARDTPGAIGEYLGFVANPALRVDALAALARTDSPPIDLLAAHLEDPRTPVRLAAAQALGSLSDARAADRLRRSLAGIGRQEALLALLVSPSPRASQIVSEARQDVYLMASVQAAERQLHFLQTQSKTLPSQIVPTQSGGNLP